MIDKLDCPYRCSARPVKLIYFTLGFYQDHIALRDVRHTDLLSPYSAISHHRLHAVNIDCASVEYAESPARIEMPHKQGRIQTAIMKVGVYMCGGGVGGVGWVQK